MESVTQSKPSLTLALLHVEFHNDCYTGLDPGDGLFRAWFEDNLPDDRAAMTVVDVLGGNRMSQSNFLHQFNQISFETADQVDDISKWQHPILAYTIRNVFWNKTDEDVVSIVSEVTKAMTQHPKTCLLVNEMLSPSKDEFRGEYEHAYRRRDVTTMTMHNAKQRTKPEWIELFHKAHQHLQVCCTRFKHIHPTCDGNMIR